MTVTLALSVFAFPYDLTSMVLAPVDPVPDHEIVPVDFVMLYPAGGVPIITVLSCPKAQPEIVLTYVLGLPTVSVSVLLLGYAMGAMVG